MALRHLGPTFDIHTGGEDNVFPHHEDEIAQSAPIVGGIPARLWVHGAHLLMSGRKMSKSAGNFQRITELVEAGLDPLAFRYLCLGARYARKLNLSDESLAAADAGLASLRSELAALGPAPTTGPWAPPAVLRAGSSPDRPVGRASGLAGHGGANGRAGADVGSPVPGSPSSGSPAPALSDRASAIGVPLAAAGRALHDAFTAAIDDDLNTPVALRIARQTLRASAVTPDERRWLVLDMDFVLGLDLDRSVPGGASDAGRAPETGSATGSGTAGAADADAPGSSELPAPAAALLAERARARGDRNWERADQLRDALRDLGIDPIDQADGTSGWRRA